MTTGNESFNNAGLQLEEVTVEVPDGPETLTILDRLSIEVVPGEVAAVIGESGSGKSTMMAVAGLLRTPDSGTVRVAGVDTAGASSAELARLRGESVGLVFQSSNLFPALRATEQLEFVADVIGRRDGSSADRAAELLETVGLGSRLGHRPSQMSGGERQRVAIARALMNSPSVLLADEPTAALDHDRGLEVMSILVAQARERGAATLIVTHNRAQLPEGVIVYRLEGGRLTAEHAAMAS
jgi:putative ABC transport system ATP-binding protein